MSKGEDRKARQDQEYAELMEGYRRLIAKEREPVEKIMEELTDSVPETLGRVMLLLGTADQSDANKSHFLVGQLQFVVGDYKKNRDRVTRYLKMKDKVAEHDRRVADLEDTGI
jgi:methyl coenzyme M reductase subunit D